MHTNKETLKELSRKYLSENEQPNIDFYLEIREVEIVSAYILGAIDKRWREGNLSDEKAKEDILKLDFGPRDMKDLRIWSECLRKLF
jgi:hypothetical protein